MWGILALVALAGSSAPAEQIVKLRAPGEPTLNVRHVAGRGMSIVYVHGSTFPSALSMNYRMNGKSWADDLHSRGFDVWSFDFAGYGGSDRPASMKALNLALADFPARAPKAAREIERVIRFICLKTGHKRVSIIAHSWGTIAAGYFAGAHPELVEKLVLFGPVAQRAGKEDMPTSPSELVTAADQWDSFQSGLPAGHPSLISRQDFELWVKTYLATDPSSASRLPPSVEAPAGPDADFAEAWSGHLPYDPALVQAPTLLVRGEWDPIARDSDVAWLAAAMIHVPGGARSVKLSRGAHRMLLEENRQALFDAVANFLSSPANENESPPRP
jgi:pimeloyl-ACP methyl ester carboxylesterase